MSKDGSRPGATLIIAFALAGVAWFALELVQPSLGFQDTDSPTVSLRFLTDHADVWVKAGLVLLFMGLAMIVAAFVVAEMLAVRSSALVVRSTTAIGLFAAAFLFMHGVLRSAAEPLLYIDGLNHAWGQAAFLVVQVVGIHGFAQAGILALCMWVVTVSLVGFRTRALPWALCLLGIVPAFRIVGLILGPLGLLEGLPDIAWVTAMLAIPGTLLWCLLLGLVLLRRTFRPTPTPTPDVAAAILAA